MVGEADFRRPQRASQAGPIAHARGEGELRQAQAFLDSVIETIPAIVFAKDMHQGGRYVLYNKAGAEVLERPQEDLIGLTDDDLFEPALAQAFRAEDEATIATGRALLAEGFKLFADGRRRFFRTTKLAIRDQAGGDPRFVLGISEDITERREMELRLAQLAHYDALTALPNRVLFQHRLHDTLARRRRGDGGLALLYIDLDHFKAANDTFGHRLGDALLGAAGRRLADTVRATDHAARLGGDEFAVIQPGIKGPDDAAQLAARLIVAMSAPYDIGDHPVVIGATVGIAFVSDDGSTPSDDQLLHEADTALYKAKSSERGTFQFFDADLDRAVQTRRALTFELRDAFARHEFRLHFQPFADVATRRTLGYEALLRWRHPQRGLVLPGEFIPIAEETGLIVDLGRWALREACLEASTWDPSLKVAVNLSAAQFKRDGLLAMILSVLAETKLDPRRLELEVTESIMLLHTKGVLETLHELRCRGISIALDDFGTGYSSLSVLRAFPFDRIKIDRSFIRDLDTNANDLAIVRAITRLAADLGVATTAEGVETNEQFERIRLEGCLAAQGYLFGAPEALPTASDGGSSASTATSSVRRYAPTAAAQPGVSASSVTPGP